MYLSIYIFPVPESDVDAFLRIMRAAGDVYLEHGATGVEVAEGTETGPAYGCAGLADAVVIRRDERLFVGIDRFRDRAHRDEVMAKVDADPRIDGLYKGMAGLVDLSRVVRGEFQGDG